MARRVQELAAHVRDGYGGDAARVWTDAADAGELRANLAALPGFGEMKVKSMGAVLAKHFDIEAHASSSPGTPRWVTWTRRRPWSSTRSSSASTRPSGLSRDPKRLSTPRALGGGGSRGAASSVGDIPSRYARLPASLPRWIRRSPSAHAGSETPLKLTPRTP